MSNGSLLISPGLRAGLLLEFVQILPVPAFSNIHGLFCSTQTYQANPADGGGCAARIDRGASARFARDCRIAAHLAPASRGTLPGGYSAGIPAVRWRKNHPWHRPDRPARRESAG